MPIFVLLVAIQVHKFSKIRKLTGFYFPVISWIFRNQTYDVCQYIDVEYVHHVHLFSIQLNL